MTLKDLEEYDETTLKPLMESFFGQPSPERMKRFVKACLNMCYESRVNEVPSASILTVYSFLKYMNDGYYRDLRDIGSRALIRVRPLRFEISLLQRELERIDRYARNRHHY